MAETYNLVLVHHPDRQSASDFLTIRNMMVGPAPDIDVHVLSLATPPPANFWPTMAKRPTLIFSFASTRIDPMARGRRIVSLAINKMEEINLMKAAGFAVPEARLISPGLTLDEAEWGPFTVVKPNRGIRGRGVRLVRTRDLGWVDTAKLPTDHPHFEHELVAQRYVETGPYVACYRVMTLLGRPIYCVTSTATERLPEFDSAGSEALNVPVAANGMKRKMALCHDEDVIELATSLHAALPHLPVMGVDIIREYATGRLYLLEFNSHGFVWHLSSKLGYSQQRDNGINFYSQFHALETMAEALAEATRALAT